MNIRRLWYAAIGVGLVALLALAVACTTEATTATPSSGNTGGLLVPGGGEAAALAESLAAALRSGQLGAGNGVFQASGIHVTGLGEVEVAPDLAILSLGVEARGKTVEEARSQAAGAMTAIVEALKGFGLEDKDIQTRFFNIRPEYEYLRDKGTRILVGYLVTNSVTAKVRDLERVGSIIDGVVQAGGDLTRIDSVSFTVEDPQEFQRQAREMAVKDALAKADQFATLTGVTRGTVLYIAESGGPTPVIQAVEERSLAFAEGAPAPITPISGGELTVRVTIQAVFAIQ